MRTVVSLFLSLYCSFALATDQDIPDLTCGNKAQNAVVEVYKDQGIVKVFMTSGGYTDIFDLYQTNNSRVYCDDQDTRLCFYNKKKRAEKSQLFFLRAGVKIEVGQVNCFRNS